MALRWMRVFSPSKFILILSLFAACGCVSHYKPRDAREEKAFHASMKNLPFEEVRSGCKKYLGKMIAWTGVIKSMSVEASKKDPQESIFEVVVEHHDFDWILDTSQREVYWLAPHSQGNFTAILIAKLSDEKKRKEFIEYHEKWFAPGNMFLGYGNVQCGPDRAVYFFASEVNPVMKGRYSVGIPGL